MNNEWDALAREPEGKAALSASAEALGRPAEKPHASSARPVAPAACAAGYGGRGRGFRGRVAGAGGGCRSGRGFGLHHGARVRPAQAGLAGAGLGVPAGRGEAGRRQNALLSTILCKPASSTGRPPRIGARRIQVEQSATPSAQCSRRRRPRPSRRATGKPCALRCRSWPSRSRCSRSGGSFAATPRRRPSSN